MYFFVNLANVGAAHLLCETAFKTGFESGYSQAAVDIYENAERQLQKQQGRVITAGGQLILPGSADW